MSKEIIINVTGEHSRIAIVEDGELVELYIENPENVRTIGDIYLGRVRRILPGIKAAFVDIGQKQDAFLHFSDLSDNLQDLLELSDGKVLDWASKPLTKAPKQDESGSSGLELETPEEQRAARRRRDLNRTHGKGRRGRGRKQDETSDAENAASSQQADAQDATSEKTSEKSDGRRSKSERSTSARSKSDRSQDQRSDSRGSRKGQSHAEQSRHMDTAPPEPPVSVELPGQPPQLLPPDAVTPPPQSESGTAQSEAPDARTETNEQSDRPKKRRGRRGGRGRNRGRATDDAEQQDAPSQDTASDTAAETDAPGEAVSKQEQAGKGRSRSTRGRGGRARGSKSSDRAESPRAEAEAPAQDAAPEESAPETSSRRSAPSRQEQRPPRQSDAERGPEASADEPKPKKKEKKTKAAASPSRSSRFVIDLTSKPAKSRRADRDDVEEEEEEEENKSSRNRRRSGRRRSGRGGSGRGNSGSKRGESSDTKAESNADSQSGSGRSKGRGDRSNRGRGGRSSSNGSSSGPRPETYLKQDQKLIVKITKEPISSKGPRVSTDVSLAGRFLVLIPQADYVAVSKKIESAKERRRLRALARSLLPEGFGLIVRTVAENRDAKALDTDLRLLLEKWRKIEDQLKEKPKPPKALHEDVNMVSSIIRDLFSEDYDRIVVDDPKVHRNVKNYVQAVAPQMAANVTLHKSKEHVFRTYKIERDVRAAFETKVPLPGGGYLFIEHTEAMHVVDVNSGRAGRGLSQEENSLRVNVESAKEIAKQLRLRDLGGIICVDFIDMRSHSARQKVYDELKKQFRKDRAVTKLLPMSDFGVVEITRQRLRPSITTTTNVDDLPPLEEMPEHAPRHIAEAPFEEGAASAGPAPTAVEIVAKLEQWLATYRDEVQEQHRKRPILLRVHPFLAAYLDRGIPSTITRWRWRTRLKFRLDVNEEADPLDFVVLDEKSGKNLTRKYDVERREEA